jgi:hypothetical protein|tara:strand:+ start:10631 stop:11425 length:795 start_codon:yes stop_codon:yes gene_type:complete
MNQSLLNTIDHALGAFDTHGLCDINNTKLMDRVDSKFVVPAEQLPYLLQESRRYYSLLSIDGIKHSDYLNVYFDTDDFNYYHMHHNGKLNRFKVRHRHYVDTGTAFLELKFKSNKGRTVKTRRAADLDANKALIEHAGFLSDQGIVEPAKLQPSQTVGYQRICLASESLGERVTLDTKASFIDPDSGRQVMLDDVVIVELKQRRIDRQSPFYRLLRSQGVRPQTFSKYCAGVSLTTQNRVKTNRFRRDINKVAKLSHSLSRLTF